MTLQNLKLKLLEAQNRSVELIACLAIANSDIADTVCAIDNDAAEDLISCFAEFGETMNAVADAMESVCHTVASILEE